MFLSSLKYSHKNTVTRWNRKIAVNIFHDTELAERSLNIRQFQDIRS